MLPLLFLAATVSSHGLITSSPSRVIAPALTVACGASVAALVTADNSSHVEGMPEAAALISNFKSIACKLFMCKGLQFADNVASVQTFQPGQVVNMFANTAIGAPLISFTSYADESLATLPANNTNFNVTTPTTLGSACSVAGTCVLQWFWFGTAADQTYEPCVDMVVPNSRT